MTLRRTVSVFLVPLLVGGLLLVASCATPAAPPAPTKAPAPAAAPTTAPAAPAAPAAATKAPAAAPTAAAAAPKYPTKAVEIIIPYAPGGATDVLGRLFAAYAQDKWKVPVSVTNKAGGSGLVGEAAARQAAPDGYTLHGLAVTTYYGLSSMKNPPFQPMDMTVIARWAQNPVMFTVKADSKWNTLKEVVDDVKKAPENYKIASPALAGLATFTAAKLWLQAGIDPTKIRVVVFEGGAPSTQAVAGGAVDFTSQNVGEGISLIEAKKLRALAVTTSQRVKLLPDVPTGKEAGFSDYDMQGWIGMGGPAKLPDYVVTAWEQLVKEAMDNKDFMAKFEATGFGPGYLNGKDFRAFMESETKFTRGMAEKLGIMQ